MENTIPNPEEIVEIVEIVETVESAITSASETISVLASYIPSQEELAAYIPAEIDFLHILKFALPFAAVSLLGGLVGRVAFGKRSSLNHAVSSAMGILFMVIVTALVYTFDPYDLAQYLSPLPYVGFTGDYLVLFSFLSGDFAAICAEVLSMVILAFLVNLLDTFIPKGERLVSWYLLRFVTVVLAMAAHILVTWAIASFVPVSLATYAPIILLGLLVLMLLLGVLNILLGAVLTVVNPFLGAVYAFFFSNIIGKQLTKAVLTTVLLTALAIALEYLGYTVLCIASAAWGAYLPLLIVLLVLWYLIGHIL